MEKESSYQKLKKLYQETLEVASYRFKQIYEAKKRAGLLSNNVKCDDMLVGNEEAITFPKELSAKELESIISNMRYLPPEKTVVEEAIEIKDGNE